jgi:hypothetical protein
MCYRGQNGHCLGLFFFSRNKKNTLSVRSLRKCQQRTVISVANKLHILVLQRITRMRSHRKHLGALVIKQNCRWRINRHWRTYQQWAVDFDIKSNGSVPDRIYINGLRKTTKHQVGKAHIWYRTSLTWNVMPNATPCLVTVMRAETSHKR